jgi:hypothetical protein
VGYYSDSTGGFHSFLDDHEVFTEFDVPSAGPFGTLVQANNARGQIVGLYVDSGGIARGFLGIPNKNSGVEK